MQFTKMHGCGNDYICVNGWEETVDEPEELAGRLCTRRYGVGADGLIIVCPSLRADIQMKVYHADGTTEAICGNGIRCASAFAYEKGLTAKKRITIETDAGIHVTELAFEKELVIGGRVNMGTIEVQKGITVKGLIPVLYPVYAGDLHGVLFDVYQDPVDMEKKGRWINRMELFPRGIHVEAVQVIEPEHIHVQVWERGSGLTLSCGTGACAAAAVCMEKGMVKENVLVHFSGGTMLVEKKEEDFYLTGPVQKVYEGKCE